MRGLGLCIATDHLAQWSGQSEKLEILCLDALVLYKEKPRHINSIADLLADYNYYVQLPSVNFVDLYISWTKKSWAKFALIELI